MGRVPVLYLFFLLLPAPGWALAQPGSNPDSDYAELRSVQLEKSYRVDNLRLNRDVAEFHFISGTLSLGAAVLGRPTVAVFEGKGRFELAPRLAHEIRYLMLLTGSERVHDEIERVVFYFTDDAITALLEGAEEIAVPGGASKALKDRRNKLRKRREQPRSFMESLVSGTEIENVEAELLTDLYRMRPEGSFNAYIEGREYDDLRFLYRPSGALPGMPSPEEVALLSIDPGKASEGILYLAHRIEEQTGPHVGSDEDHSAVDAIGYRLDVEIDGEKLIVAAAVSVTALKEVRVLRFGLLPTLRVEEVTLGGQPIDFIQEGEDADGAFYVIFPETLQPAATVELRIRYAGDEVLDNAGGGNYSVGARTSWYPSLNAFNDRATFDITFWAPRKLRVVSVGSRVSEERDGNVLVTRWVSEVPLTVAGFNYGRFKERRTRDEGTGYEIEGFATANLPETLRGAEAIGGMSPARLMDNAMVDAQNSIRVFNHWFGPLPYGRLAITQQPELNFGQSWPSLVYLPIIAFFDSTQRWRLFGGIIPSLTNFVSEVTPHEVAHQWWGHLVSWSTYHDQWISEGFAEFSASLWLEASGQSDRYLEFWEDNRKGILEEGPYGVAPNDVASIWMGLRLQTNRTAGAYSQLVYPKGAFILQMLRWMMHDRQRGDERFRALLQDFIRQHHNQPASTEDFKRVAESHLPPELDLDGTGRLDWFFNQYVYGTAVGSYRLQYRLEPADDGKTMLTGTLTQDGVPEDFKMLVPLYVDFGDDGIHQLGKSTVVGKTTTPEFKVLLPRKPRRVLINAHGELLAREIDIEEVG